MKTLRNAKGFTLIELIMVIVILGILAAVAIPKYVNLKEEAQNATKTAITGALNSTESILFAGFLLGKNVTPTGPLVLANTTVTGVQDWNPAGDYATGNIGRTLVNWNRTAGDTNMPGSWKND